jgi:hypothetical protein
LKIYVYHSHLDLATHLHRDYWSKKVQIHKTPYDRTRHVVATTTTTMFKRARSEVHRFYTTPVSERQFPKSFVAISLNIERILVCTIHTVRTVLITGPMFHTLLEQLTCNIDFGNIFLMKCLYCFDTIGRVRWRKN